MVVNRYGYYIAIAIVTNVDINNNELSLKMLPDDKVLTDVVTKDSTGYKIEYISLYAPNLRAGNKEDEELHYYRAKDEDIFNIPTGFFNLPKLKDYLLIAVYLNKDPMASGWSQDISKSILVLGQIQRHMPILNAEDNIFIDRSGAKIHFNNNWFDSSLIERPSGHLTIVGNRVTTLAGKNFLNFSLLSFLFQKGLKQGETKHDPELSIAHLFKLALTDKDDTKDGSIKWSKIFTRDKMYSKLLIPKFSGQLQSLQTDEKFLEPPPPPIDGKMDLHESGHKTDIFANGNELQFKRAVLRVIGEEHLKYAFSRDGKESNGTPFSENPLDNNEVLKIKDIETQSDAVDLEYHSNGSKIIATEKNRETSTFGLETQIRSGITIIIPDPTDMPTDITEAQALTGGADKPTANKFKVVVGKGTNKVTFEIDGVNGDIKVTSKTFTWVGDLDIDGKLTVSGDAELKGTTTHGGA